MKIFKKIKDKIKSKTDDFWVMVYSFIFAIITLPIVIGVSVYISYLIGKIDEMTNIDINTYMTGLWNTIMSFTMGALSLFLVLVFIAKRIDKNKQQ
jgi:hypothetical protein